LILPRVFCEHYLLNAKHQIGVQFQGIVFSSDF
jgi:hypothetical protein